MAVADSAFLIDVLAEEPGAMAKLQDLVRRGQQVWVPAALQELYYGAGLSRDADAERRRIEELEQAMPPLPFGAAAAKAAGAFEAQAERAGRRPSRVDVQIAAVALVHGEPVLTRDRRFPAMPGLAVERY